MRFVFAVLIFGAIAPSQFVCAQSSESMLNYSVSFSDADRHLVDVEVLVPTDGNAAIEVVMPVWTPGSYLVREYAKNIVTISATALSDGSQIAIEKIAKNRWRVECNEQPWVRVRYQLYCREMSVRTNWVERDFGVLTGAATFLTREGAQDRPHRVSFALPSQWSQVVSGLPNLPEDAASFVATDFDSLVDNPFVLGNPQLDEFQVQGVTHRLVTINDGGLWDNRRAAEDVQRIVESHYGMWKELPYEQYTFLNVVGESGGGLEHDNCTLLMTSRWSFRDPSAYRRWLGLVSHELFHAWNVRRMRPLGIRDYDYNEENYFRELWIAEGVTSYYDDLLQVRAGLLSQKDYLSGVARNLKRVMESPGASVQSLSDSSFDAWIKFYRPDENSGNSQISYYTKGALVAWLLDAKIRIATQGGKSLDDVMRLMWARHAREPYTLDDFNAAVESVAGVELREFLTTAVEGTEPLNFQPVADLWGIQIGEDATSAKQSELGENAAADASANAAAKDGNVSEGNPKAEAKDDDKAPSSEEGEPASLAEAATASAPKEPYLGASIQDRDGRMIVERITRDSPADMAGWNVDDELVGIAEYRVTQRFLSDRLRYFPTEQPIDALLSRRGKLIERPVVLQPFQENPWSLKFLSKPSDQQAEARKVWLKPSETAPSTPAP